MATMPLPRNAINTVENVRSIRAIAQTIGTLNSIGTIPQIIAEVGERCSLAYARHESCESKIVASRSGV